MRKRLIVILCILSLAADLLAITQEGAVRTIARKGQAGEPVAGTVIRIRGSHNAVASRENGYFSLLLQNLQNGEEYVIASIVKSDYEPAEQELIGKRLPCSEFVPLEIVLVSSEQLRREKEAIARKARENVELFYQQRVAELEKQVADKSMTAETFSRRMQELENQYERFEPLLQTMSDKFARTDYKNLDSVTLTIQEAIEQGDLDTVERLIRMKGDLEQREQAIREQEAQIESAQQVIDEAAAQLDKQRTFTAKEKKDLADDYYRLYAAFLSRFVNDSAAYYIRKRAELDTLNVDYQLQAGQFVKEILADYALARFYFERAYRIAQTQYGEWSGQMATTCHELGSVCKLTKEYDAARQWYGQSLSIREKIRGKNSPAVAETLNNLGELYRAQRDLKNALACHKNALKIREKHFGQNSLEVAESKNNIAGVFAQKQQWKKALRLYQEVRTAYAANERTPERRIADNYTNLSVVAYSSGEMDTAEQYIEQAVPIYRRVFGEAHPMTRNALSIQQAIQKKQQK